MWLSAICFCILSCSYIILLNISKYHLNWKLFEKTKLSFKKKLRKDTRRLLEDLWWSIKFSEKKSGKKFYQNWRGKPKKSRRILLSKIFDHPNSVRTLLHSTFFGKFLVQCCCCFFFFWYHPEQYANFCVTCSVRYTSNYMQFSYLAT